MPYNPRPISEGGNRGIDDRFSRKASKGKFRVVGVDTFDGGDWVDGDFESLEAANARIAAKTAGAEMLMMHVYKGRGRWKHPPGEVRRPSWRPSRKPLRKYFTKNIGLYRVGLRRCAACSETKSVSQFRRDKSKPTGLKYWCKECTSNTEKAARKGV